MVGTSLLTFKWALLGVALTLLDFSKMDESQRRELEGQRVELTGFPYKNEGETVLGRSPGMRSCCFDESSIIVPFSIQKRGLVTLEGVLQKSDGKWHLIDAKKE